MKYFGISLLMFNCQKRKHDTLQREQQFDVSVEIADKYLPHRSHTIASNHSHLRHTPQLKIDWCAVSTIRVRIHTSTRVFAPPQNIPALILIFKYARKHVCTLQCIGHTHTHKHLHICYHICAVESSSHKCSTIYCACRVRVLVRVNKPRDSDLTPNRLWRPRMHFSHIWKGCAYNALAHSACAVSFNTSLNCI